MIDPVEVTDKNRDKARFTIVERVWYERIVPRTGISPLLQAIYFQLKTFAWDRSSCFPSQQLIADRINVSRRSVVTGISELAEKGLIEILPIAGGVNQYVLVDYDDLPEELTRKDPAMGGGVKNLHTNKDSCEIDSCSSVAKATESSQAATRELQTRQEENHPQSQPQQATLLPDSFATSATPPSSARPPKASAKKEPQVRLSDHWAVRAYHAKMKRLPATPNMVLITETVTDPDLWERVMTFVVGRTNNINNVSYMLDVYRQPERMNNVGGNSNVEGFNRRRSVLERPEPSTAEDVRKFNELSPEQLATQAELRKWWAEQDAKALAARQVPPVS